MGTIVLTYKLKTELKFRLLVHAAAVDIHLYFGFILRIFYARPGRIYKKVVFYNGSRVQGRHTLHGVHNRAEYGCCEENSRWSCEREAGRLCEHYTRYNVCI